MSLPESKQNAPYQEQLTPKSYYWCACGRSSKDPFCDGSHKVTEFVPVKFEISEEKSYWLCGCKHSTNPPFCDGTHKS